MEEIQPNDETVDAELTQEESTAAEEQVVKPPRDWWLLAGRILDLLIFIALMVVVVINHRLFYNDDAFITFRYAENFAAFDGLVYHVGEPILGSTAPLYAIMLGIFSWPFGNAIWAGFVLGWLGFAVMAAGLYLLCEQVRRGSGFIGLLGLAFFSIDGAMKYQFGMESHWATGLGFLAVWIHLREGRTWPLGVFMAMMLLMRPDAVFLGAVIALSSILMWRMPWGGIVAFLIIIGLWCAYAFPVYGSPVPHTVGAKYELGQTSSNNYAFVTELLGRFHMWYWGNYGLVWIALLGLFAGVLANVRAVAILFMWIVFHFLAFAIPKIESFDWYYIPIFAVLYVGVCVWPLLLSKVVNRHWFDVALRCVMLCGAIWMIPMVSGWVDRENQSMDIPASPRTKSYHAMTEWLKENAEVSDTLACIEIGVLGYYTGMRILDLRGLVTPESLEHISNRDYDWWNGLDPLPKYAVIHRQLWRSEGASDEFLTANYRRVISEGGVDLYEISPFSFANLSVPDLVERRTEALEAQDIEMLEALARQFTTVHNRTQAVETWLMVYDLRNATALEFDDFMRLLTSLEETQLSQAWFQSLIDQAVTVGNPEHLKTLADIMYRRGLYEECALLIQRQMRMQPDSADVKLQWGRVLWRMARYEEAEVALLDAAKAEGVSIWAHRTLAMMAEETERWEDALQHWEICLESNVDSLVDEASERIPVLRDRVRQ